MLYYIAKVLLSGILITLISEAAKRNSIVGAILASVPLVSVLAMCWLYIETHNTKAIAILAFDIFWLVIPSLIFFIMLTIMLKHKIGFGISMLTSLVTMTGGYFIMLKLLRLLGLK